MESTGQAKAEAQSHAEAAKIEGQAAVEQARLKSQATKIEAVGGWEGLSYFFCCAVYRVCSNTSTFKHTTMSCIYMYGAYDPPLRSVQVHVYTLYMEHDIVHGTYMYIVHAKPLRMYIVIIFLVC